MAAAVDAWAPVKDRESLAPAAEGAWIPVANRALQVAESSLQFSSSAAESSAEEVAAVAEYFGISPAEEVEMVAAATSGSRTCRPEWF